MGTSFQDTGSSELSLLDHISSNMVNADLRHSNLRDKALGREDFDPHSYIAPSYGSGYPLNAPTRSSFSTSSSVVPVAIDKRYAENTLSQNDRLPNKGTLSATYITEQAGEDTKHLSNTSLDAVNTILSKGALEDLLRAIKAMDLPQLSGSIQPQASSRPLRDALLPMIMKNVQRRPDFNNQLVTKVEVGLREALTDQFCDSLSQRLEVVKREIQATRGSKEDVHATAAVSTINPLLNTATVASTGDSNTATSATLGSASEPPKAPRAMRLENTGRLTNQGSMESSASLPRSGSKYILPDDSKKLGHCPSEEESAPSAHESLERGSRWDRPMQKHKSNGIPIPLDPLFFTASSTGIQIKRESPNLSKAESFLSSRSRRSRSPRRRSRSVGPRHSPYQPSQCDISHRRPSYHEMSSNRRLSRSPRPRSPRPRSPRPRSPRPRSRDRRPSLSNSRIRSARSPPPKRRRPSFSRSRSPRPSGSYRSGSRPRQEDSFSHRTYLPHRGRSRSPYNQKTSSHDRKSSFRHRSPETPFEPRRTPVHMRSIDRTRPSPPLSSLSHRRNSDIRHHVSRSPEPLSAISNRSHRPPLPNRPPSPDSDNHQRRQLLSSHSRTRSPSPVNLPFHRRLSRPPDENRTELLGVRMSMQTEPLVPTSHRDSPKNHQLGSTPVLTYERTQPPTPDDTLIVKREPDIEDFTTALRPSPPSATSPAAVPSPSVPTSPQPDTMSTMESAPPLSSASVATMPPLSSPHVSYAPQSPTDSHLALQESVHQPDIPPESLYTEEEESQDQRRLSVENRMNVSPSPVPSPGPSEVSPVHPSPRHPSTRHPSPRHPSPRQPSPVVPSSTPSPPSQPPVSTSMATQPSFTVPGYWFAKHGHDQADIVDCEFEVNSEIAQKWNLPGSSNSASGVTSERLSLQLLCIPVELLQNVYQIGSVPGPADLGALTSSMMSVNTAWPEQGSLLVQMNPTKPHERSWFPEHMGPASPGLDITDSVREGKNVLRLIQLEDMTNKIFMLQALLLPAAPQQHSAYWDIGDSNLAGQLASWNLLPATVEVI